jgi:hypothetical protein
MRTSYTEPHHQECFYKMIFGFALTGNLAKSLLGVYAIIRENLNPTMRKRFQTLSDEYIIPGLTKYDSKQNIPTQEEIELIYKLQDDLQEFANELDSFFQSGKERHESESQRKIAQDLEILRSKGIDPIIMGLLFWNYTEYFTTYYESRRRQLATQKAKKAVNFSRSKDPLTLELETQLEEISRKFPLHISDKDINSLSQFMIGDTSSTVPRRVPSDNSIESSHSHFIDSPFLRSYSSHF